MRRTIIFLFVLILGLFLISAYSFSQTLTFAGEKKQQLWGNYFVSGVFGLGYYANDVSGDKNLFFSQFNLRKGLNVSQISFRAYRDPEKKGFLDVISLDVKGFNAEPYGRASFELEKRNVFSLNGGYTERKIFADVASFANPLFAASSEKTLFRSFHTWDTKEKSFDLSARLKATSWLSIDASWQRTKFEGSSLTTLRLLNNEFPLDEPVNQTSHSFQVGSDVNIKNRVIYRISGIYQKFELDQTASSKGTNVGIRGLPSGNSANYLTSQSRRTQAEIKTWALSQSLHIIPAERFTIDGHFSRNWTDGTSSGNESIEGRFLWPLYDYVSSASFANTGELKKDLSQGDFSLSYQVLPQLRLRAGYDTYKYTIENSDELDFSFTRIYYNRTVSESLASQPLVEMQLNRVFADAGLSMGKNWTASAGYAHSTNKLNLRHEEEEEESFSYKLNSFYGTLGVKISERLSLKTSVERGDYNRVFARLVPLEATSLGVQANFHLEYGFSGSLFYKNQNLKNEKFNYSSSLNGYGVNLRYQQKNGLFGAFLHLSANELESSLAIVRYLSLFTETEDISEYISDTTQFSAGFWFRKGIISLDGGYSYTKTEGNFPLRMHYPYITAGFRVISGLAVTLNYRLYDHKQINLLSQNYKAHIFNIGFLFAF